MTAGKDPDALIARCPCGASKVALAQMPSVRFICHCGICQSVYPGDYADAALIRADMVRIETPGSLNFSEMKAPPAVNRGICASCNHPVVGFLKGPLLPKFAFLPSMLLPRQDALPGPMRHIYYESRRADIDDGLPKSSGDFNSKMSLLLPMLKVACGR